MKQLYCRKLYKENLARNGDILSPWKRSYISIQAIHVVISMPTQYTHYTNIYRSHTYVFFLLLLLFWSNTTSKNPPLDEVALTSHALWNRRPFCWNIVMVPVLIHSHSYIRVLSAKICSEICGEWSKSSFSYEGWKEFWQSFGDKYGK